MASETRFLRIFECKILSLNFVQNDNCAKQKRKPSTHEGEGSHV